MRAALPSIAVLSACAGRAPEEMERALALTNDAIAWGLLAAEGAAWADETDPRWPGQVLDEARLWRHGAAGNCPTLNRTPEEGFPFDLDVGFLGCVSGSGLLPTTLSGLLRISGDAGVVRVGYDEIQLGAVRTAAGALIGARDPGVERYELVGDLSLPESALLDATRGEIHLTVDHTRRDEVRLDGFVAVGTDAIRVDLDQVRIALADIPGECPLPHAGASRVHLDPEVAVDLSDASRTDRVVARRRARSSKPTRLCAFSTDVF